MAEGLYLIYIALLDITRNTRKKSWQAYLDLIKKGLSIGYSLQQNGLFSKRMNFPLNQKLHDLSGML